MPRPCGDDEEAPARINAYFLGRDQAEAARFLTFGGRTPRQIAEKAANALERLLDRLAAGGIGKPHIVLAEVTKAGPGDRRDSGLVEEAALEAPGVEQDDALLQLGIAEETDVLGAVIEDLAIDLVAHHRDVRVFFEPGDEAVEFLARHDAARRIGRAVDDEEPGLRRDLLQHLL